MKTIVIVSDVLIGKQVNGVGTWLINTKKELEKMDFKACALTDYGNMYGAVSFFNILS